PDEVLRRALLDGVHVDERRAVRQDGTELWMMETITPLFDPPHHHMGFAVLARDTTADRERQRALDLYQTKFKVLFEHAQVGSVSVLKNQQEGSVDANTSVCEIPDLSLALDALAREEARYDAEKTLRSEKRFSDTVLESMPGILYFYDMEGRFLRWNKNFEARSEERRVGKEWRGQWSPSH